MTFFIKRDIFFLTFFIGMIIIDYQLSFLRDVIRYFSSVLNLYILGKSHTFNFFLLVRKSWQLEAHSIIWLYNMRFFALLNGAGGHYLL